MSKVVTSPIERWAGTVTLADPLTSQQAYIIEQYRATQKEIKKHTEDSESFEDLKESLRKLGKVPTIEACVEKWELSNFPLNAEGKPDPFPASPRGDSHKLIDWLYDEIEQVYFGETFVPNE